MFACRLAFVVLMLLSSPALLRAESFHSRFSKGGWKESAWTIVKSPRWDRVGTWVQREDCIENATPEDAEAADLLGKRASETYSSMVVTKRFSGSITVEATLLFEDRMAPLIVIAPELGKDAQGRPEYREHFEIVLYDKGVNVWHHAWADGKPSWKKAAYWLFPVEPETKHTLKVQINHTSRGKMLVVTVGEREMGYIDDTLPTECHVGITGCEGVNRFYHFQVQSE